MTTFKRTQLISLIHILLYSLIDWISNLPFRRWLRKDRNWSWTSKTRDRRTKICLGYWKVNIFTTRRRAFILGCCMNMAAPLDGRGWSQLLGIDKIILLHKQLNLWPLLKVLFLHCDDMQLFCAKAFSQLLLFLLTLQMNRRSVNVFD